MRRCSIHAACCPALCIAAHDVQLVLLSFGSRSATSDILFGRKRPLAETSLDHPRLGRRFARQHPGAMNAICSNAELKAGGRPDPKASHELRPRSHATGAARHPAAATRLRLRLPEPIPVCGSFQLTFLSPKRDARRDCASNGVWVARRSLRQAFLASEI